MKKTILILLVTAIMLTGCSNAIDQLLEDGNTGETPVPSASQVPEEDAVSPSATPVVTQEPAATDEPSEIKNTVPTAQMQEQVRLTNICIQTKLYQTGPRGRVSFSRSRSLGSGILFKISDGYYYALTNWHVIEYEGYHSAKYIVTDYAGKYAYGEVVLQDKSKDLAVIRFKKKDDLPLMDINDRKNTPLKDDELVIAVGNPGGEKNVVTYGYFKGMAKINVASFNVINHNAKINHGSSGGALCDGKGNLVGVNTWGNADDENDNFAVPLSVVHEFLYNLK